MYVESTSLLKETEYFSADNKEPELSVLAVVFAAGESQTVATAEPDDKNCFI